MTKKQDTSHAVSVAGERENEKIKQEFECEKLNYNKDLLYFSVLAWQKFIIEMTVSIALLSVGAVLTFFYSKLFAICFITSLFCNWISIMHYEKKMDNNDYEGNWFLNNSLEIEMFIFIVIFSLSIVTA